MNYNILRENDIRGRYPDEINEEVVVRFSKAFSYFIKEKNYNECLVGYDNRLSSESLHKIMIDTLVKSGIKVTDIGLVTTPMLNFASIKYNMPYALMITASHNDSHDNGIKIFGINHLHLAQYELQKLYDYIKDEKETYGNGQIINKSIKEEYINYLINEFGHINKNVVVDCGNGTASTIIKDLFDKIFFKVSYVNSTSDGTFPIHNPDPNVSSNLKWLIDQVKLRKADLGIAIDGDSDRVGIVDEKGNIIPTDYLIAIFAKDIVKNNENKNILIDVKCSIGVEHEIKKCGGNPITVKNGSAYIESEVKKQNALLGGEYSGHIFFRDKHFGFDDGIYAGLRFAKLCENTKASSLFECMEKYFSTEEIRIKTTDDEKIKLVEKVKEYAINNNYNCNFIDGVRVNYDDGFALIRKSNTGPFITLRFEAGDEVTLNKRKEEFLNLIK